MKIYFLMISFVFVENTLSQTGNLQTAQWPGSNPPGKTVRCMTGEEREMYNREAIAAKQRWQSRADSIFRQRPGRLTESGHLPLGWPMRISGDYDFQYKYFYKGNFVDQYPGNAADRDYECGGRTYEDHDASDISTFPFWWRMMDNNYVTAVAAAPGIIILKVDTVYDRRCEGDTFPGSNRIFLLHEDGSTTRYHHLKRLGVTGKDSGEYVRQGEFLGYVASSGNSSHPHLHFAVYDGDDDLIEPFFTNDPCHNFNEESWWINQHPYWDARINRVMTHSQPPLWGDCESEEDPHPKNRFDPGELVYVGIAFSEFYPNNQARDSIFKPDGSFFTTHSIIVPAHSEFGYNNNYVTTSFTLPPSNFGTWKIKVDYNGNSYYHFFNVGCNLLNITVGGVEDGPTGLITGNSISSTVSHNISGGDRVLYQAPNAIEFKAGFHAPAGIVLKARLKDCNFAE